jgi:protein-S-isoprenylcysteine O-methyltransferase Ste14
MVLKLILQALFFTVGLAVVLAVCAGTADWPGAWIFLAAMQGGGLAMTLWLAVKDPELLKDRARSRGQKKGKPDRILMPLLNVCFFAWLVLMALDVRWHGTSQMPVWVNISGGILVLLAFLGCIRVFRENTFATAVVKVQTERGHHVVDTGPYGFVRHPLYSAALLTYLAIPFALGSWAGLAGLPVLAVIVMLRARCEEAMLKTDLAGYCDYMEKVRYRFVPRLW